MRESDVMLISDRLRELHESGDLPVKHLARLLAITPAHAYRYLVEVEPRWSQFYQIVQGAPPRAQEALVRDLLDGTGWVLTLIEADLDADGDGVISAADAMGACADIAESFAAYIRQVQVIIRDGRIDAAEREAVSRICAELIQAAARVNQIVARLCDRQASRHKARPVSAVKERA